MSRIHSIKLKYYVWRRRQLRKSIKKQWSLEKIRKYEALGLKWYSLLYAKSNIGILDVTGMGLTLEDKRAISDLPVPYGIGKGYIHEPKPLVETRVVTFVQEYDGLVYVHINGERSTEHGETGLDPEFARNAYGEKFIQWN